MIKHVNVKPKNELLEVLKQVELGELTEDEALPTINKLTKNYKTVHLYPNRKERRRIENLTKRKYEGPINEALKSQDE